MIPETVNFLEELIKRDMAAAHLELEDQRYHHESFQIAKLAFYALNKPKNASKGDYETVSLERCLELLLLEVEELKAEINTQPKNVNRILDELADVTASCVGIYANVIDSVKKSQVVVE